MKKLKFFSDFQKEEKWLEAMAAQGWQFKGYSLFHIFEPAQPQQVNIRIDYREFENQHDFEDYCSLFADSGWRHIVGTIDSGSQYFMRMDGDSNEDIFSDSASRAGRYKRMANTWLLLACVFLPFPFVLGWYYGAIPLTFFIVSLYTLHKYKKAEKKD